MKFKKILRKIKWYSSGYWKKAYEVFKGHFSDDRNRSWYKSLWSYIYFDNKIFEFFYDGWKGITNFLYEIKRFYDWRKVLWKNHDWDFGFFFPIIQHKLERMAKSIEEGHASDSFATAAEIKHVLILLDKVQKHEGADCPYSGVRNNGQYQNNWKEREKLYEADLNKLFKQIVKYHRGWWD